MPDERLPSMAGINIMKSELVRPLRPESFEAVAGMDLEVRNLGFGVPTGGAVGMQVFRANGQKASGAPVWHMHDLQVHVGYITKGWALYEFEGLGEVKVEAGTGICHLPCSRMRLLDRSPDFEGVWVAQRHRS